MEFQDWLLTIWWPPEHRQDSIRMLINMDEYVANCLWSFEWKGSRKWCLWSPWLYWQPLKEVLFFIRADISDVGRPDILVPLSSTDYISTILKLYHPTDNSITGDLAAMRYVGYTVHTGSETITNFVHLTQMSSL